MGESGSVLAAFVQIHLGLLDEAGADDAQVVRGRTDPERLHRIEKSSRLAWLPLEDHLDLTERIRERVGPEAARELCHHMVLAAFEQPFMRPLVATALALTGACFERFAGWAPRSWPALYRRAGRLRWELDEPEVGRMILGGAPEAILASVAYVDGLAGGFEALFDVTRCTGTVEGVRAERDVVLHIRWSQTR